MKLSNLIWPLAVVIFLLLLATPTLITETQRETVVECEQIIYRQRGDRLQMLVVCPDTLFDTGTAFRHEAFQDTIKQIRVNL